MTQPRTFRRAPRRGREWFPANVVLVNTVAGTPQNHILDTAKPFANKKDSTIVRMLIELEVSPFLAGTGSLAVALGITLVNADAHAAGALPEPGQADQEDADWLWNIPLLQFKHQAGGPQQRYVSVDIHSKRKYNSGNDLLVLIAENSGVASIDVVGSVRTLVLDAP